MEWIKTKDKVPNIPPKYYDEDLSCYITPLSVQVICFDGDFVFEGTYFQDGTFSSAYFDNEDITHWMPLPEPPKTATT